ncbi:putative gamma-interferon inducible lysosomal thiol reductase [Operophtera brumata]|uniref:Putative gamma-interferon inducible lysosomal thiol reductase n=1 Tax=Operophtera brumata TaxID=104452 RepID=A0A0L7LI76_OPEBR|nr:putative gamma-interferon inducible lysosomal thiol reductase [Operophtera brumata]
MAAGYMFTILACLFLVLKVDGLETVNGKVKVTIQTTSGCGDTVRFIRDDLAPTYELYKDFMEVDFVPWGRATRNEDGVLSCQFGENDCWANRLHRCALNLLKGNQDAQVHYMTCEYTTPFPSYLQGSYLCAHAVGLSLVDVDYCVANPGDELDLAAEVKGNELTQALNFIPSVVFNDHIDPVLHNQALQRFLNLICLALANDPQTGVRDCAV